MKPRVDLFVFDLAGTVVVDDDHVLRALEATCRHFELPVARPRLRGRMGLHKEEVFRTLLRELGRDEHAAPDLAKQFEREFARVVAASPLRPTRGAMETLLALVAGGVQIAFNTGFSRATADLVLRELGLARWPSVASDEVAHGRPAPDLIRRAMALAGMAEPARVGVAGDTPADLAAGAAAGAGLIVGVGCGTHTLAQLASSPHTHLVADLSMLPAIVLPG